MNFKIVWYIIGVLGVLATIVAIYLIGYISENIYPLIESGKKQDYDLLVISFILSSWLLYFISSLGLVRYKLQSHKFNGIGLLGPLGLIIALLMPNRRKYKGMVKVEVDNETIGYMKYLPKGLQRKKYDYIPQEEFERRQQGQQEELEATVIEVKTADGKTLKLKTAGNATLEEVPEEGSSESGTSNTNSSTTSDENNTKDNPEEENKKG